MDGKELLIILVRVILEFLAYYNAKVMYTCSSINHISPILTMYLTHSSGCIIIVKDMLKYRLKYFEKMEKDTGVGRITFMMRVLVLSMFYNLCHIPKFYSMKCLSDAYIVSIYGSSVLFSHVFSLIFNIDKISYKGIFSMVLCLAGLIVIVLDDASCRKHYVWAVICFIAAVFSGLYTVLLKICIEIPEKVKIFKNGNLEQKKIDFYENSKIQFQKKVEMNKNCEIFKKNDDMVTNDIIIDSEEILTRNIQIGKNIENFEIKNSVIGSGEILAGNLLIEKHKDFRMKDSFIDLKEPPESNLELIKTNFDMAEVNFIICSKGNREIKNNIDDGTPKNVQIDFKTNIKNDSCKYKSNYKEIQDPGSIKSNINTELLCLNVKVNEDQIDTQLDAKNKKNIPTEIPSNSKMFINKSNKDNETVKPNSNVIHIEKENINRKLVYMKYYMGLTGLFTLLFYWPFLLLVNMNSIDKISIPTQGRQIFHIFAANILSLCQNTIYLLLISYKSPVFAQVSGIFFLPTVVIIQLFRSIDIIHCTEILGCFSIFFSFCLLGKSKKQ